MSIKVTDVATGSLPGQYTIRVECSRCNTYFEGDYIRSGNEKRRAETVKWIVEQGLDQLTIAGCPHAADTIPAIPK